MNETHLIHYSNRSANMKMLLARMTKILLLLMTLPATLLAVHYTYDANDQLVAVTYAPNQQVVYEYDAAGNLITVRVQSVAKPVITQQPQSLSAAANSTVQLSVIATSHDLISYQWRLNGQPIAGAKASVLSLTNIQPVQAGVYDVVVGNSGGEVTSETALLSVASAGNDFVAWANGQSLPANASGPMDDPDQDGVPNVLEYALATNPLQADRSQAMPQSSLVKIAGEVYLAFTYRQPKPAPMDLRYEVTASPTVFPWSASSSVVPVGSPVDKGDHLEFTVRAAQPVTAGAWGFLRLNLEQK
jgi:YD repeat-containing protein